MSHRPAYASISRRVQWRSGRRRGRAVGLARGASVLAVALVLVTGPGRARAWAQVPDPPPDARYAASVRGEVFYWVGCSAWKRLSPGNIIFFPSRAAAESAGYSPSRSSGCEPRPEGTPSPVGPPLERYAAPRVPPVWPDGPPPPDTSVVPAGVPCTVERITDGDTIRCVGRGPVRLLLMDTPEMDQRPHGAWARSALAALVPPGSRVTLELDVQERDRYGRILAHVWTSDGVHVNRAMVRAGYAVVLVYPPNVHYVDVMRAAAVEARGAGRGVWGELPLACEPVAHRAGRC